ncbi:M14 family zinc carboxypeptidase [Brevibacillus choshinensis]|uniref:M14 family zinc carboxypeptidase n=1 Tax=Brevibacillus choshinensis TaxID=54911 RepID=UPI002E22533F|nr:M14 family zinc carboxypeptidase [Brevibacillus choshinensis]MED4584124.1 M14 family zinc carboxypeptidase [Brevibacillus choshinensis]MED4755275.1 M14 family zinc carboxypeptidase [Brevibacillus choshinensis]
MKKISVFATTALLGTVLLAVPVFANDHTVPGGPSTNGEMSMESIVTYSDMIKILGDIARTSKGKVEVFKLDDYGKSEQGRSFYVAKVGNGPKKIWIQARIHGNERLTTEAALQLVKTMGTGKADKEVQKILDELTLYVIPIYNPDGSEMNTRTTQLIDDKTNEPILDGNDKPREIDLNRDWNLLDKNEDGEIDGFVADESKAFYKYWADLDPDFMIDLHHQGLKTVPGTNESTSMSLGVSLAPNGPTLPDTPYNDITRQAQGYVFDALSKYGYTHIDRYTVGDGQYEIDIRGGVTSGMMLALDYEGLNTEGHSNPAIFFETKGMTREGSLGQKSNGYLTKQNYLGLKALLFGLASGEVEDADPEHWEDIPHGEIAGYSTDYAGTILK